VKCAQIYPCSQFILPGFIDTHIHASQYVNAGKGLDLHLLDWLDKYTFPAEAKFHDVDYADNVFNKVVVSHLLQAAIL